MRDKNLNLNTSPPLPSSDAGMVGGTNGSLSGASRSDLERGYVDAGEACEGDVLTCEPSKPAPGFCGRPNGWER